MIAKYFAMSLAMEKVVNAPLVSYWNEEMKLHPNIEIKLNTKVDVDTLRALNPDQVIVSPGGGRGHDSIVMVTLGTGVGGGVILQGKILTGCKGAGGEIGHMKVNMDETRVCGCGNKGCLEQYASATGIVNMAKENVPEGSYLADKKVTAKAVFDGAKESDACCMKVVEKFGRYLGVALSNVAHVVDPEAFVIGGGVSAAGQILLDVVEKYYNENSMFALKNKSFHLA